MILCQFSWSRQPMRTLMRARTSESMQPCCVQSSKHSPKLKTQLMLCQWLSESWGEPPFDMHSAADALEKLARGAHDDPLLDVSWWEPYHSQTNKKWNLICISFFLSIITPIITSHVWELTVSFSGLCRMLDQHLDLVVGSCNQCKLKISKQCLT